MNQINPATANGKTIASVINEWGERIGKIEEMGQAMTMKPIPWYRKIILIVKKHFRNFCAIYSPRENIGSAVEISDVQLREIMKELRKEEYMLDTKRRIARRRNFLTKLSTAYCITKVTINFEFTDSKGNRESDGEVFRGKEISLLMPYLKVPGLAVQSDHPEDL